MNPIGDSLQIALRGTLKMNARARDAALRHDGRGIALEMPNLRLVIRFEAGNVYVDDADAASADRADTANAGRAKAVWDDADAAHADRADTANAGRADTADPGRADDTGAGRADDDASQDEADTASADRADTAGAGRADDAGRDADANRADATVRGSMAAVFAHLSGLREDAAVLGDVDLVDDFRESFKPHFDPREFMAYAQDAMHTGLAAMESAFEAFRHRRPERTKDAADDAERSELAAEVAKLAEEVRRLNERIDELQNK